MRRYIALIQADRDHGLTAKAPDFPGLSASAKTLDKLRETLGDHLAAAIEAVERAGAALPEPSSFETLMADPRNADHAAMLISAKRAKPAVPGEAPLAEPFHAGSNDEWPEADA
jgi:predicted RNase H-like HicB family nuclease